MYDIIGDIHGQAGKLKQLLLKMGYQQRGGSWHHAERTAIFVGDFIDRGPDQLETLNIVKQMVLNGDALAVMGNHEFNAIGWSLPDLAEPGQYLRRHNDRNRHQHKAFLQALDGKLSEYLQWIEWFKSLPLYIENDNIRIIHACWDEQSIQAVQPYIDSQKRLLPEHWNNAFDKRHPLYDLLEVLLKGMEMHLPDNYVFSDKDGITRKISRIKWWLAGEHSLRELLLLSPQQLSNLPQTLAAINNQGYQGDKPVFIGHYWLHGHPHTLTNTVACVDYSAAIDSGKLVAYRWQGELSLTDNHFIY